MLVKIIERLENAQSGEDVAMPEWLFECDTVWHRYLVSVEDPESEIGGYDFHILGDDPLTGPINMLAIRMWGKSGAYTDALIARANVYVMNDGGKTIDHLST